MRNDEGMYDYRKATPDQRLRLTRDRLAHGFPPHSPPHPVRHERVYLVTAACYEHASHMSACLRREQLLNALLEELNSHNVEAQAWAILPNHYHLLVKPREFNALGRTLRLIHGRTSRQWNDEDHKSGRKVWYRFTDRVIRSERHYYTTLNYIHYNPVKHGLAKSPYDWRESSVH